MKKALFYILVVFSISSCQKDNEIFEKPNFNNHILEDYFVTSIAFDSKGNAWIGTFDKGLLKYNNGELTVFNSANSPINEKFMISDIAVDSKNNIWIGSDCLLKYDGKTFTKYNSLNSPIPEDFVKTIAIDSKDNVWFSSSRFRQGGLVCYNNDSWQVFTPENSKLPANLIIDIDIDKNDNIWLAMGEIVQNNYLVEISGKSMKIYNEKELGFKPYMIKDMQLNTQGDVYCSIDYSLSSFAISSYDFDHPMAFVLNKKTTTVTRIKDDKIRTAIGLSIFIDNNNFCWLYGGNSYTVLNSSNKQIYSASLEGKDQIIFTINQDVDDKIWIGTTKGILIN